MLLFIPFSLESGLILSLHHSSKASTLYMVMNIGEFFLLGNTWLIYATLKKVVTSLTYLKDEQAVEVTKHDWLLRETSFKVPLADLIKSKGQGMNPMVGYRSTSDAKLELLTEGIGKWDDRQIFDSVLAEASESTEKKYGSD